MQVGRERIGGNVHRAGQGATKLRRQSVERYNNLGGNSGVSGYEIGADFIRVEFERDGTYLYDYATTGAEHVEHMKVLARTGQGLGTYITQNVRNAFARKEK